MSATNSAETPLVRELGIAVGTVLVLDPLMTPGVVTGTIARDPEYLETPWEIALHPGVGAHEAAVTDQQEGTR